MRRNTLANMLLLCGFTAGTAAMATGTAGTPQATNNSMTMNTMMSNDMMTPMPGNEVRPAPMPRSTPTPGMTTNEMSLKPM